MSDHSQTAHIVIDMQHFYSKKMHQTSARALAKRIDKFREALRARGIPTIWVVFEPQIDNPQKMIILPLNVKANMLADLFPVAGKEMVLSSTCDEAHNTYTFGSTRPHDDEIIFSKVYDNGFANGLLNAYLKQSGFTHLLFSGLYTSMCISDTIRGGLNQGYHCTAITDLMNDEEHPAPKFCQRTLLARTLHEDVVSKKLKNDSWRKYQNWWRIFHERFSFSTADDYLMGPSQKPRRPKTPVKAGVKSLSVKPETGS